MKHMKKIIATGLAVWMSLSVVASATYTDMAEIAQQEAVAVLTATQIMEGDPDGAFRPEDRVTRGEMTKMMMVLLGGEAGGASDFTDCQTHWANGYIAAAVEAGIVDGNGDGTFSPDNTVTGMEAAKMMLVALGYDGADYVGADWQDAVEADCDAAQLLIHLENLDLTAPLTRQDAAALLLGGLEATVVAGEDAFYQVQFPALTYEEGYTWYWDGDVIFTTVEETEEETEEADAVVTETDDLLFIHGGSVETAMIDGEKYYIYDSYLNGEKTGELKSANNYEGTDATKFYGGSYNSNGEFVIEKLQKTVNGDKETVVNQAYLTLDSLVDRSWMAFSGGGGVFADGSDEFYCGDVKIADLTDQDLDSLKALEAALENGAHITVAVVGNSKTDTVDYLYIMDVAYRA